MCDLKPQHSMTVGARQAFFAPKKCDRHLFSLTDWVSVLLYVD